MLVDEGTTAAFSRTSVAQRVGLEQITDVWACNKLRRDPCTDKLKEIWLCWPCRMAARTGQRRTSLSSATKALAECDSSALVLWMQGP